MTTRRCASCWSGSSPASLIRPARPRRSWSTRARWWERVVFESDGLRIELPASWDVRMLRRSAHLRALHAGSFPLDPDDEELGAHSTALMEPGDCFVGLVEYLPGSGIRPGQAPFNPR